MSATNKVFRLNVAVTGTETVLDSSHLFAISLTILAGRCYVYVVLKPPCIKELLYPRRGNTEHISYALISFLAVLLTLCLCSPLFSPSASLFFFTFPSCFYFPILLSNFSCFFSDFSLLPLVNCIFFDLTFVLARLA